MKQVFLNVLAVTLAVGSTMTTVKAQSRCDVKKSSSSQGLILSITKTAIKRDYVNINMTIANTTKSRVYIVNVVGDQGQYAQLENGERLPYPIVSGMPTCSTISICKTSSEFKDPSTMSYIEANDNTSLSFSYYTGNKAQSDDSISYSPTFMIRLVKPNGDTDKPSPMQAVRFNLNSIPIDC